MKPKVYRQLCLFLVLGCGLLTARGQVHQWAFDIQNSSGLSFINSQAVDDSSNVYIAGIFRGTMYLGTDTFTFAGTNTYAIFLAKFNKNGSYIWGRAFTSAQSAFVKQLLINSQNQILMLGSYSNAASSSISFGNTTLSSSAAVFVAFADASGNFTSAKDLAYASYCGALAFTLGTNDEIVAALYLNGFGSNWNIVNGSSTTSGSGYVFGIAKYNSSGSALSWSQTYPFSQVTQIFDVSVDRHNQVYFTCRVAPNQTIFNQTTPSSGQSCFLVWLRPDGTFKDKLFAYSTGFLQNAIEQVEALDSNRIYLAGYSYQDSIALGNNKIYSSGSLNNKNFNWVAELRSFNTLGWSHATSLQNSGQVGGIRASLQGDYLYFSALQYSSGFSFGGFSTTNTVPAIVSKIDRLGNVLWYLPIGASSPPMLSGIENQDMVYSGGYDGTLNLSPYSFSNTTGISRPFVARTFDYSITRGLVRSGPYCAGDTLLVPYKKVGEFDTSNVFTAELSDEKGEFNGGQRELGRIKTTRDSTIIGKLPLFQVASSGNYRIRVTSSSPVVQSYYKLDTLNLLIYSRDKADPGPDTLMCYGDTIQLNTFGGTKWNWSPAFAMSDSTLRNPLIWPLSDTLYTIVISDSSGCGLADTADIRVKIRPKPQFSSQSQSDTLVCINQSVILKNSFGGGLNRYHLTWQTENGALLKSTTTAAFEDSLEVFPTANSRYRVVLTDSCSSFLDTLFYTVKLFDTMQVSRSFTDTLLCIQQGIRMAVQVSHLRKDSISYRWSEVGSTSILSSDSSYASIPDTTRTFQVRVNNACNLESKDFLFTLKTQPPLSNSIQAQNPRTFLCDGDSIRLVAFPLGGRAGDTLQTIWEMLGMRIIADTLVLYADSLRSLFPLNDTFTVMSIASDACSTPDDTAFYGFRLYPILKIDSVSGLESRLCYIQNQVLSVNADGGLGSSTYAYQWLWNGQVLDTMRQFTLCADSFPAGQNLLVQAAVKDRCSRPDTASVQFYIPEKPSIQILGSDTSLCSKTSVRWKSQRQGGDTLNLRYNWRINGSLVSLSDTFSAYFENFKLGADSLLWLSLALSDSCSPQVASDSILIRIAPNPLLSFKNDSLAYRQYSDTTLCRGESMLLRPKNFYTDLGNIPALYRNGVLLSYTEAYTLTNTDLIPEDSVVFQAITASNCGTNADTALYVVHLRKALDLAPLSDSLVCANTQVSFNAQGSGGLGPTNHIYTWFDGAKLLQTGASLSIVADSFQRGQSNTLKVKLEDGCSSADSVSFQLFIPTQTQVAISGNDTALCSSSTAIWSSTSLGGQALQYAYTWRLNGDSLSNASNFSQYFEHSQPGKDSILWLSLSLDDGCATTLARDSIQIILKPNSIVSFGSDSLNPRQYTDTLICRGELVNLKAKAFYHLFEPNAELYRDNVLVGTNGSYQLQNTASIAADSILILAINPAGCGLSRDTASYVIRLREALKLDFIPDTQVCAKSTVAFSAAASGGIPSQYRYTWLDRTNNAVLSQSQSLALISVDRSYSLQVVLEDGCSAPKDTVFFQVRPLDSLFVRLSPSAICADTIVVNASATGGRPSTYQYRWSFDGAAPLIGQSSYTLYPNALSWLKLELSDGCSGINARDSIQLSEKMRFDIDFTEDSVCEPFTANWSVQPKSATPMAFNWREGNGANWLPLTQEANYAAGDYAFAFLAENSLGCRDSLIQILHVKPKPDARFAWSPQYLDQDNALALISTDLNASSYTWSLDDTLLLFNQKSFSYQFTDSGNYRLKLIVDLNGCKDTAERPLRVEEAFRYYEVTAFTPNGDQNNETYRPYVTGNIKELRFEIFNSWGQKIFSGDLENAWDGTYQGVPAPMGYYLVVISISTQDGRKKFEKTMLYLFR